MNTFHAILAIIVIFGVLYAWVGLIYLTYAFLKWVTERSKPHG